MTPVRVNVRTYGDNDDVLTTKQLNYNVIQNEKRSAFQMRRSVRAE